MAKCFPESSLTPLHRRISPFLFLTLLSLSLPLSLSLLFTVYLFCVFLFRALGLFLQANIRFDLSQKVVPPASFSLPRSLQHHHHRTRGERERLKEGKNLQSKAKLQIRRLRDFPRPITCREVQCNNFHGSVSSEISWPTDMLEI